MIDHHQVSDIRDQQLADIAIRYPSASRVFHRNRLDWCCGGRRSLTAACLAAGLDPDRVLAELTAEDGLRSNPTIDWSTKAPALLVDHIVQRYHATLRKILPHLHQLIGKVASTHGDRDQRLHELAREFTAFADGMESHMRKEEEILFPAIIAGVDVRRPVGCMLHEHDEHADRLRTLRELCDDYRPPEGACASWRALYASLDELEREVKEHIHLENNVLFPRAAPG